MNIAIRPFTAVDTILIGVQIHYAKPLSNVMIGFGLFYVIIGFDDGDKK
jgi:hypothetical protein